MLLNFWQMQVGRDRIALLCSRLTADDPAEGLGTLISLPQASITDFPFGLQMR